MIIELVDLCDALEIMVHFNEVRVEDDGQVEKLLCIGQFLALTLILGVLHLELLLSSFTPEKVGEDLGVHGYNTRRA